MRSSEHQLIQVNKQKNHSEMHQTMQRQAAPHEAVHQDHMRKRPAIRKEEEKVAVMTGSCSLA